MAALGTPGEYVASGMAYGFLLTQLMQSAACAVAEWQQRRAHSRAQLQFALAPMAQSALGGLQRSRLRWRWRMPLTYADIKGDTPFVEPKHNGTDTSKAAAQSVRSATGKQAAQVLALIREAGQRGLITDEAEAITGGKHQAISARFNDLHNAGMIYCNADDPKDRRPTRSGRSARIYRAIEFKPAQAAE